jgi:transposase-like protein
MNQHQNSEHSKPSLFRSEINHQPHNLPWDDAPLLDPDKLAPKELDPNKLDSNKDNITEELIRKRLETLELAEKLGNVSEACRITGMDRTSFYEWRKRFNSKGLTGLENKSSAPKKHPFTTPAHTTQLVVQTALKRPEWGCIRIASKLAEHGLSISSPTVQKILIQRQLGKRNERLLALEYLFVQTLTRKKKADSTHLTPAMSAHASPPLNRHQLNMIEKANSSLCEINHCPDNPGELLVQDIMLIGKSRSLGHVYLQIALDCYHLRAFANIHRRKHPQDAIFLLRNQVQPHYEQIGIPLERICTDEGTDYFGDNSHPFQKYLQSQTISHVITGNKRRNNNGHLRRFIQIINKQFLGGMQMTINSIDSIQSIQLALHDWLTRYNNTVDLPGFPNFDYTVDEREAIYTKCRQETA